jgi:hypothetical protein
MKFPGTTVLLGLCLSLSLVVGAFAAMEKAELITGNQWTQWEERDKLVYIRGLGNWADFVNEAQTRQGKSREFSLSRIFVNELRHKSLGQVVANVDAYYRQNPEKLNTTVIEAILRSSTAVCPK